VIDSALAAEVFDCASLRCALAFGREELSSANFIGTAEAVPLRKLLPCEVCIEIEDDAQARTPAGQPPGRRRTVWVNAKIG